MMQQPSNQMMQQPSNQMMQQPPQNNLYLQPPNNQFQVSILNYIIQQGNMNNSMIQQKSLRHSSAQHKSQPSILYAQHHPLPSQINNYQSTANNSNSLYHDHIIQNHRTLQLNDQQHQNINHYGQKVYYQPIIYPQIDDHQYNEDYYGSILQYSTQKLDDQYKENNLKQSKLESKLTFNNFNTERLDTNTLKPPMQTIRKLSNQRSKSMQENLKLHKLENIKKTEYNSSAQKKPTYNDYIMKEFQNIHSEQTDKSMSVADDFEKSQKQQQDQLFEFYKSIKENKQFQNLQDDKQNAIINNLMQVFDKQIEQEQFNNTKKELVQIENNINDLLQKILQSQDMNDDKLKVKDEQLNQLNKKFELIQKQFMTIDSKLKQFYVSGDQLDQHDNVTQQLFKQHHQIKNLFEKYDNKTQTLQSQKIVYEVSDIDYSQVINSPRHQFVKSKLKQFQVMPQNRQKQLRQLQQKEMNSQNSENNLLTNQKPANLKNQDQNKNFIEKNKNSFQNSLKNGKPDYYSLIKQYMRTKPDKSTKNKEEDIYQAMSKMMQKQGFSQKLLNQNKLY